MAESLLANDVPAGDILVLDESWAEAVSDYQASLRGLLEHPFLAVLGRSARPMPEFPAESGFSQVAAPAGALLYELAECTGQTQVCETIARANGGLVDLKMATLLIRRVGLSNSRTDSALVKNLGTRLQRSGDWVRCGASLMRWLAMDAGDGTPAVSANPSSSFGASAR